MPYDAKLDFDWSENEHDPDATIDRLINDAMSTDPPSILAFAKSMRLDNAGSQIVVEYPYDGEFTTSARLVFDRGGLSPEEFAVELRRGLGASTQRMLDVKIVDLDYGKSEPNKFNVRLELP